MNLFKDIIPSLTTGRVPVCQTEEDFKQYPAYQVNAALSYYQDCIFFVNEMNMKSFLTNEMQHDFYFFGLRKYKRPFSGKWAKKTQLDDFNAQVVTKICGMLKCNRQYAMEILDILTNEEKVKIDENY